MRHRVVVVLGFLCAGVASAGDDEESFPVRDLVTRPGGVKRATRAVSSAPLLSEGRGERRIAGENRLMAGALDDLNTPWFDGQSLCAALDAILPQDARRLQFDEKALAVCCAPQHGDAVARALADVRARAPQAVALKVSIERWPADPGIAGPEKLLASEGHAEPARTVVIADAIERRVVADYDVEVAQASSVGDPILSILRTGASAAVCVTPMPDGRSAVVEVVARTARELDEPPIQLGHKGFGTADRCAVAFDELASCLRVQNGRPSETAWIGRDGARMVLRIEVAWKAPPPPGDPVLVVSPLFRSVFMGFRNVRGTDLPNEEVSDAWDSLEERSAPAEQLVELAFHDPAYASLCKGGTSLVALPASGSRGAADRFAALAAAADVHMKGARAECLVVNAPAGAVVSFDAPLPPGAWAVAQYDGSVVLGLPACSTGGTDRRFIADWDVEVAQSSRIADPLLMEISTGHFLNFTAREHSVEVDLDLRRLDRMERQEMQLAVGRVSQGVLGEKDKEPWIDPSLPPERVAVEKPVIAQLRVAESIPLGADGTGSLRRTGAALTGAGRELVVLVRVR